MIDIDDSRRARRQSDAVQAEFVKFACGLPHLQRGAAIGNEIFGVAFDQAERGCGLKNFSAARVAQARPREALGCCPVRRGRLGVERRF